MVGVATLRVQTDVAANELSDAKQRELELEFECSVQRLFAELSRSLLARALIDSHKEDRARGSLRMRADDQACHDVCQESKQNAVGEWRQHHKKR